MEKMVIKKQPINRASQVGGAVLSDSVKTNFMGYMCNMESSLVMDIYQSLHQSHFAAVWCALVWIKQFPVNNTLYITPEMIHNHFLCNYSNHVFQLYLHMPLTSKYLSSSPVVTVSNHAYVHALQCKKNMQSFRNILVIVHQ